MRGIISYGTHVPYNRLQRSAVSEVFGGAPGKGSRAVASYDEDTTSMGVEAGRRALRDAPDAQPGAVWFATSAPPYLDKTNATTIHAALRLDTDADALDMAGAVRSGVGALRVALRSDDPTLVVSSDIRTGLPTSADEAGGGDGASALLVGDDRHSPVLAEFLGAASATEEFLDRWRLPGEDRSQVWEERFVETMYVPLGERAWNDALKAVSLSADDIDRVIVTGTQPRAVKGLSRKLGTAKEAFVDDLSATVGNTGTAHPGLLLASVLDDAEPAQTIALVVLADGAEVLLFRTTDAVSEHRASAPIAGQISTGDDGLPYGKFLRWREMVTVEPPRRPPPTRTAAPPSVRSEDWKFAFVGSRDRSSGALHLPPQRVSWQGGAVDDMDPAPMADVPATVVTFTVDRMVYSPSPPVVFAVLDFDGGGRLPCELTDVDAGDVAIGDRVEMTFRRLYTAEGVHNYFWKARPIRTPEG